MQTINADICVIGAGSGGLSVATGAAQMGARVVLIENNKMGGECLNSGCVPSKALISAANIARTIRDTKKYGIKSSIESINYEAVHKYINKTINNIAPHDSKERMEKLGITVLFGTASFINPKEVSVANTNIKARYFVIATGSLPTAPPTPGLKDTPYLTNATIFALKQQPEHLVVLGGGPIGCELAQAHRALGTKVTLLQHSTILNKDDPELVDTVRKQFITDGISLFENTELNNISYNNKQFTVDFTSNEEQQTITGSHLLVATGRKPNIEALQLENAKVKFNQRGIIVNNKMQSSQKHIYAVGDVAGSYQFTHIANYQAGIAIRNILFHLHSKVNYAALPWTTFTDPEIANAGMHENDAREIYGNIKVLKAEFNNNDRANTEGDTRGFIKVITKKNGKILGASIVGHNASELIQPWIIAITQKQKIKTMASFIAPYPTRGEISKVAASEYYKPALFSPKTKKIVQLLLKVF